MRFPGFEGEWEQKNFKELFTIGSGRDYKHLSNGDVPVFGTGGLMTYVNECLYDGESVCIGRKGTINKPYYHNGKFWTVDTLFYTHSFKKALPKFVYYIFQRIDWLKYNEASGVPSLSKSTIEKIEVYIPKKDEQEKLMGLLSALDGRIQTQNKIIEGLKQLKTLVSKKIFSQQLRFNDEHGNEFPEWEVKKMGDVAKIYDGTHQTPNYVDAGIPFYSVEHLTANQFSNTKFISTEVYNKENKRVKLERGDILMTRIGSIGVAKYIDWDVKASFYVSLALIKNSDKVNNKFLCHFINTDFFQAELWKRTIHVAFPKKINLGEISECQIKVPNISEQNKVADLLSKIEHKFEIEIKLLKQFESQKQYIQSNVFI